MFLPADERAENRGAEAGKGGISCPVAAGFCEVGKNPLTADGKQVKMETRKGMTAGRGNSSGR